MKNYILYLKPFNLTLKKILLIVSLNKEFKDTINNIFID